MKLQGVHVFGVHVQLDRLHVQHLSWHEQLVLLHVMDVTLYLTLVHIQAYMK